MPLLRVLSLCLCVVTMPASAHEFWISPEQYQIAEGAQLTAHLRVGEGFEGGSYSYIPDRFVRFEAGPAQALSPVAARVGDRPALAMPVEEDGLWLVVHETTDSFLTYREAQKFTDFIEMHDLGEIEAAHAARGLPETGFRESYRRHAKALVAVGAGAGVDRRLGLTVEIVAEANPYALATETLPVRLWQYGAPRADGQLEVFTRLGEEITWVTYRSDAEGRVQVPAPKGAEMLLNFVTLLPVEGDMGLREPVWHSDWASLTFRIPE